MNFWQNTFVLLFGILSTTTFLYAFWKVYKHDLAYADTPWWYHTLFTSFVWADHIVFGVFWAMISIAILYLNDWILFLLLLSFFRLVRSTGEVLYWFLEQFAVGHHNPPQKFWLYKIFHNDSVWFVLQIINQCWMVIFGITTLFLANLWLKSL
jgi:hypothetical protein